LHFTPEKVGGLNVAATYTANFTIIQYTITATAGSGGTISPIGDVIVDHSANQNFTMIPDQEYRVADVLVDGFSVGAVDVYEFTNVTANHTIHVTFELNPCCDLTNKFNLNDQNGWIVKHYNWYYSFQGSIEGNNCGYSLTLQTRFYNPEGNLVDESSKTTSGINPNTGQLEFDSGVSYVEGEGHPSGYRIEFWVYDANGLCDPLKYIYDLDLIN